MVPKVIAGGCLFFILPHSSPEDANGFWPIRYFQRELGTQLDDPPRAPKGAGTSMFGDADLFLEQSIENGWIIMGCNGIYIYMFTMYVCIYIYYTYLLCVCMCVYIYIHTYLYAILYLGFHTISFYRQVHDGWTQFRQRWSGRSLLASK